jgi:hypothetical protein
LRTQSVQDAATGLRKVDVTGRGGALKDLDRTLEQSHALVQRQ